MTNEAEKSTTSENNKHANSGDIPMGNVDQIRDIIFGSQMRDYESRFQGLEKRLMDELAASRKEVGNRVDALETYMHSEMDALNERLSVERSERENEDKEISDELKKTAKEILKKLSSLDESVAKQNRELRQQLLEQSKTLSSDIESTKTQLNQALTNATDELRNSKTDRAALADLLSEVALRLKDEFSLPAKK